jgi:hypothetical protein
MSLSLISIQDRQTVTGALSISDASRITSLTVIHESTGKSRIFNEVNMAQRIDVSLSNQNTEILPIVWSIANGHEGSKILNIYLPVLHFHLQVNGHFYDINLEIDPKLQEKKHRHREFDY